MCSKIGWTPSCMMTGDDICQKAKRWPVVSSVLSGKEACSHACRGHTSQSALRGTAFHWGGPEAPGKWPRGPGAGRTAGDMRADGVRSETGPRCGQQLTPHWQGDHGGRGCRRLPKFSCSRDDWRRRGSAGTRSVAPQPRRLPTVSSPSSRLEPLPAANHFTSEKQTLSSQLRHWLLV